MLALSSPSWAEPLGSAKLDKVRDGAAGWQIDRFEAEGFSFELMRRPGQQPVHQAQPNGREQWGFLDVESGSIVSVTRYPNGDPAKLLRDASSVDNPQAMRLREKRDDPLTLGGRRVAGKRTTVDVLTPGAEETRVQRTLVIPVKKTVYVVSVSYRDSESALGDQLVDTIARQFRFSGK
ncbi:hypothetical protein [Chitinimonas lacunae]|uniref:Uncharacterized protein n=1 Tax=Chitinimonas lacunae TaxID=1963018 RepID=A0ABV8MRN9_9NEIS